MGQTPEDIRDNIVKIVGENDNYTGTGFFIHKKYCVTCHHTICGLNEIYVERGGDNSEGAQQRKRKRYHAEWVEEFSDMQKDIAFLRVKSADLKPLEYRRETYGNIPVVVRGFPLKDLYNFSKGRDEKGILTDILQPFRWKDNEIVEEYKKKKWNMKPEVNVQVYAFNGKFYEGFSGAPICYRHDWKVVGMFEAKDENQGFIIPIEEVIKKFDLEKKEGKASAPSSIFDKQKMITIDPQKIIDIANEYFDKSEYGKAIEQYDIILDDPKYAHSLNAKGLALYYLGRYEEAIKQLDGALDINPNYYWAWNNKGLALSTLGRDEEAVVCYNRAIKIDPSYDAAPWFNKGLALSTLGRDEEAVVCYNRAIKIDPSYADVWNNKGLALDSLGKYEEAIQCYDEAIKIDPINVLPWNNRGNALAHSRKYDEAIASYDGALEIDPNYAYARYNRACSNSKRGNIEDGLADLKRAIEIDENFIKLARQEKDLENIRNDERFKTLIIK